MSEVDYLLYYNAFDDDVMARVEVAAPRQSQSTWPEYQSRYNVPQPRFFKPIDTKPIEVIDFVPRDYDDVVVYHQPMACALDANIQLHAATLSAVLPEKRLVVVGNPGQPGHGYGKLSVRQTIAVSRGNLRPVVAGTLEYLEAQRLDTATHTGESYGADKAAASAENAHFYNHEVVSAIMVEPVSVVKASLLKMGLIFNSTSKHADKYLEPLREQSKTFVSAESLKESSAGYAIGLARLSNLAIGTALGKQGFESRVSRGLSFSPNMKAGVAWGAASEFDKNNDREKILDRLTKEFGAERVTALPLEEQTHAMNLDIYLNAAIIAQLLKQTGNL